MEGAAKMKKVRGVLFLFLLVVSILAFLYQIHPVSAEMTPVTNECSSWNSSWVWCDDFEQNRLSSYFEYDTAGGNFARVAGVGTNGSEGMQATYTPGNSNAGSLHLAFGNGPDSSYMIPVDAGTKNYTDLYWRLYVKNQPGWQGDGADKLARAIVFAKSDWSEAAIGHVWSGGTGNVYLMLDPASGTDTSGNLQASGYNDVNNFRWLGAQPSNTPIFNSTNVGQWYCVEAHMKLNSPGQSNGVFEMWINSNLEAQETGLNWLGNYSAYGINGLFIENYWNAGPPVTENRYLDNIVVSTQRIGCGQAGNVSSGNTGDLNQDNSVTISDILTIIKYILGIDTSNSAADVNGDGVVNIFDLVRTANLFGTQYGSDTTPPSIIESSPTNNSVLSASTVQKTLYVETNEKATCKYSTSASSNFSTNMTAFTKTGGISHAVNVTGLQNATTYTYYIKCQDTAGNLNSTDYVINFTVGGTIYVDTTPPVISNGQPTGTLAAGTTSTTLQVSTDESAICKYSTTANTAYSSMTNTFSSSEGVSHTASVSGLQNATTYHYYVRCEDSAGNPDTSDYTITFSVAAPSPPAQEGNVTPWVEENFSEYTSTANMKSNPDHLYEDWSTSGNGNTNYNTNLISLDQTQGYGSLTQSMRYDFPSQPGNCGDYSIGVNMNLPSATNEIWLQITAKFDSSFTTINSGAGCSSNPDYKFIFARTSSGRFNLMLGTGGSQFTWGYPNGQDNFEGGNAAQYFDGQWHTYYMHMKTGTNGAATLWVDGNLVKDYGTISNAGGGSIYGIALGRNINQGPPHAQSLWLGDIKVYNQDPGWGF